MDAALEETLVDIARFRRELRSFSTYLSPPATPAGTAAALTSLYLRIASLGATGLLACESGEIYAARALQRILAEHLMRFNSILVGSAPAGFFTDLKDAEAIGVDKKLRRFFPNGQVPADVPAPLRRLVQETLIDPVPSKADQDRAAQVERTFSFAELRDGLYAKLKAHDGRDGEGSDGLMALGYAQFSSCIHGGPLGHQYVVATPDAPTVAAAASDLIAPWSSALTLILAKSRGENDSHTRAALALHGAFVAWTSSRFPDQMPGTSAGPNATEK